MAKEIQIKRVPVESSQIKSVGYSAEGRILEVEFKRGGIYRYTPVKQEAYDALLAADSVGSYFHNNIKTNSTISFEKVSV